MKVFVTGGTGNIGQHVTLALLKAGHEVKLLTRTPDRIPAFNSLPGVTVVKGNILELETLRQATQGCDAVIHIALGWGNTPDDMLHNDTRVTVSLMQAAQEAGVGNFIYTSSTAAMGPLRNGMDEMAVCLPSDLYGATKAASEMYLLGFRQYYDQQGKYGRPTSMRRNIIRPGYTFSSPAVAGGASQSDKRFMTLAQAAVQGEDITISRLDGTQFISAQQIAKLYVALMESDRNEEVFLALGTKFVSWYDVAVRTVACVPGSKSRVIALDEKPREIWHYNVSKMERVFGLSCDGNEDLDAHIRWNVEREQDVLEGRPVHDVYHVW